MFVSPPNQGNPPPKTRSPRVSGGESSEGEAVTPSYRLERPGEETARAVRAAPEPA